MSTLQDQMIARFPIKENFKVMAADPIDSVGKWKISLMAGLLFIVISSPLLYKLVQKLINKVADVDIANDDGCPNFYGLVLHGIVFMLITRLMMK